jgi:hypothetical protein
MRFINSILFMVFLSLAFASCKQIPDDEDIIIDPPDTTPPIDPFSAYTRIDSCYRIYPELCDFWYLNHFLVDSTIYVFSYDFKLAIFNLKGDLLTSKTIYSSAKKCDINQIAYNHVNRLFYFVGEIENGPGFYKENPLLLVFDLEGNLVHKDENSWSNENANYFFKIDFTPENTAVILEHDLEGSNGNYDWVTYLRFLNNSYQTYETHLLDIGPNYLDFFRVYSNSVIQIIAVIADSIWHESMEEGHISFIEADYSGNVVNMSTIGDPVKEYWTPVEPDIYNEPISIYRWSGYKDNNSHHYNLDIKKYYHTGYPGYTRTIDVFKSGKQVGFNTNLCDEFRDNKIIVYGLFQKSDGISAPVNYGNYIIKIDNNGNEEYRILFNENINGYDYPQYSDQYPKLTILEDDHYILIKSIYFTESSCWTLCFSDVKVP